MTDLDTLRPEVQKAMHGLRKCVLRCEPSLDVGLATIRAELLRLANENANYGKRAVEQYKRGVYWMDRAKEAEAELAALKARIAEAKRVRLGTYPAHGSGYVQIIAEPREGDQTFRLLVDEPPAKENNNG